MKALVIGATGAVGRDLVQLLLQDEAFERVEIFVRRDPGLSDRKLGVHLVDFDHPAEWQDLVRGDVAFSCLGTTLKAAGSQEAQYKVDYTYQYAFAKAASENGVPSYFLVSSAFANAQSRAFYTRMKGELDEAVQKMAFRRICIVRPPALIRKDTDRLSEKLSLPLIRFFNAFGLFRSQTPMETLIVAQAMVHLAKKDSAPRIVAGQEICHFRNIHI